MKIGRRRALATLGLISIATSLILFNTQASETPSARIYVDPPTIMALYDTDFTINISVEDIPDVHAWQARLKWDPNLLEFVGPSELTHNQTEGWVFLTSEVGQIEKSITFHGENLGGCALELKDTKIFDSTPIEVPVPPYLGDVNGDLIVNVHDTGEVSKAFGTSPGDPRWNPNADFNHDEVIDMYDLLCATFNFGKHYQEVDTAKMPEEIAHTVNDGYVTVYSPSVWFAAWKWLDSHEPPNEVWFNVSVEVSSGSIITNFEFNRTLGEISFNLEASTPGYCNVSIPKLLMDGAFKVLIDDTQVATMLNWNVTHTFICLAHDQGTQKITIIGEMVTRIRAPDLIKIADLDGDGKVTILDVAAVASVYNWQEDP
ncbi:MAG: hypothetical protein QW667_00975 [Candidatus Bathyarchaeia archaeon]